MTRRTGLTLVELLAALAIGALLAAAALSVTTTLARTEAVARRAHESAALEASLGRLLAADLLNAARFRETAEGFEVEALNALAADDLSPAHLPAVVTYEVDEVAGRPCLLRCQASEFEPPLVELVAANVRAVRIEPVGSDPKAAKDGWRAVERAVLVTVECGTETPETPETLEVLLRRQ